MEVHSDSQVIGDVKVSAGQFFDGETGRADQIKSMAMGVGGEVDMLSEVEAVQEVQEFRGMVAVGVVDMEVEITKEQSGR